MRPDGGRSPSSRIASAMTRLWPTGQPIQVVAGPDGAPLRFTWDSTPREVAAIANRWRVNASWWQPAAAARREYFKLTTTDGLLLTLYRDLQDGAWYGARVYD
jgi:hypothetical protein